MVHENDLKTLIELFEQDKNILLVYVFGSYSTEYMTPKSDIDFAILFGRDISMMEEMSLQAKISEKLKFEHIDMVNLNKTPFRFQFKVISSGKIIYELDKDLTDNYIEKVLRYYHGNQVRYRIFFEEYDRGLKEDYLDGRCR